MRIEETMIIERSIDEVFSYVADVERHPEWVSNVLTTKKTSDGPLGLGATFTEETKMFGRRLSVDSEVTAYEPSHIFQQRSRLGPAQMVLTISLEATHGATKMTVVHEAESGGLFKMADAFLAQSLKKQSSANLEALRGIIESGVAAELV